MEGLLEHFAIHIVRIILASGAFAVFFENVSEYFSSDTFQKIKQMLSPVFPVSNWYQKDLDAYDYGSIASRTRGYAVSFRVNTSFSWPKPVKTPISRRKKVKDFIENGEDREWRPIEGSTMGMFLGSHRKKYGHTGFTIDTNRTLVNLDSKKVACFTKGYGKIQSSQSYLKHPSEDKWSMFTPKEVMAMMNYPDWFHFDEDIPKTQQYEIIGNSVDVLLLQALADNIISALMEYKIKQAVGFDNQQTVNKSSINSPMVLELKVDHSGQYELIF